jgi:transcriptional regulator with XRE-family HTH domain
MTTGQRIAQKRKELGLSQEALGEKLGVSRQSIYKWESDAALPEIDKLVTLSRLFGLSVGALLGVEAEENGNKGELSDSQVKMVEEISRRYLDAIPQKTGRHLLWPLTALVLSCCLVAVGMSVMTHRLNRMEEQYLDLQSSIRSVSGMVDSQMDAVTAQVEEMLKAHNELTDDYAAQVMSIDPAANTVTFSFRATPKTFTEGTVAYLEIADKTGSHTFGPYAPLEGHTFMGTAETDLSDFIQLSVIFDTNGVRFTQPLNTFGGLWSDSLPGLSAEYLGGIGVYNADLGPDHFFLEDDYFYLTQPPAADITDFRFGVFLNQKLLAWAEESPAPEEEHVGSDLEFDQYTFYRIPTLTHAYKWGDKLTFAALITDRHGREYLQIIARWELQTDQRGHCSLLPIATAETRYASSAGWVLK